MSEPITWTSEMACHALNKLAEPPPPICVLNLMPAMGRRGVTAGTPGSWSSDGAPGSPVPTPAPTDACGPELNGTFRTVLGDMKLYGPVVLACIGCARPALPGGNPYGNPNLPVTLTLNLE